MHQPMPKITPARLRPPSWWYWLPAGVALFGIAAGIGLMMLGLGLAARAAFEIPVIEGEFQNFVTDRAVSFELSAEHEYGIFAPGEPGAVGERPRGCDLATEGGQLRELHSSTAAFVDDHVWFQVYTLTVQESGTYTLTCHRPPFGEDIGLGLVPVDGPARETGALRSLAIGGTVAGISALVGGAGAIVLRTRRARHRATLEAAAAELAAAPPYRAGPLVR